MRKPAKLFLFLLGFYFTGILIIWTKEFTLLTSHSTKNSEEKIIGENKEITKATSESKNVKSTEPEYKPPPGQNGPDWVRVSSLQRNAFYFSAFVQSSSKDIKLFGAFEKGIKENLQCCFYLQENSKTSDGLTGTRYQVLPESKGLRYSAAFYTCPLPNTSRPHAVSISTDSCQTPSNKLPIIYPQEQTRQFTVCVTPLNFKYSKAYELVEMIELNRILGADHFVFYNHSIDDNVEKVLQYYMKIGIVEVLKWDLPMKVDTWPPKHQPVEVHYFAQLAALNDCLYRNMYLSKYVVFEDLDEFIIPRKIKTWSEMMTKLPQGYGAYIFRCVFFRKEWPDVETEFQGKDTAKKYKMNTLLKQKKEPKMLGRTHRSKYIVDPKQIDTLGIHNIWRFRSGSRGHFVDPEFARMHHYRNWLNPSDARTGVLDDRILDYKDELLKNVIKVWESLRNVPLGPLNEGT